MKIIVGLGNPGMKYAGTRHNTGFAALTQLADRYNISLSKKECCGFVARAVPAGTTA